MYGYINYDGSIIPILPKACVDHPSFRFQRSRLPLSSMRRLASPWTNLGDVPLRSSWETRNWRTDPVFNCKVTLELKGTQQIKELDYIFRQDWGRNQPKSIKTKLWWGRKPWLGRPNFSCRGRKHTELAWERPVLDTSPSHMMAILIWMKPAHLTLRAYIWPCQSLGSLGSRPIDRTLVAPIGVYRWPFHGASKDNFVKLVSWYDNEWGAEPWSPHFLGMFISRRS